MIPHPLSIEGAPAVNMTTTLQEFATAGARVTVERKDGRQWSGVLVPVGPAEPNTFAVKTGARGRPAKVHADDVVSVALTA